MVTTTAKAKIRNTATRLDTLSESIFFSMHSGKMTTHTVAICQNTLHGNKNQPYGTVTVTHNVACPGPMQKTYRPPKVGESMCATMGCSTSPITSTYAMQAPTCCSTTLNEHKAHTRQPMGMAIQARRKYSPAQRQHLAESTHGLVSDVTVRFLVGVDQRPGQQLDGKVG